MPFGTRAPNSRVKELGAFFRQISSNVIRSQQAQQSVDFDMEDKRATDEILRGYDPSSEDSRKQAILRSMKLSPNSKRAGPLRGYLKDNEPKYTTGVAGSTIYDSKSGETKGILPGTVKKKTTSETKAIVGKNGQPTFVRFTYDEEGNVTNQVPMGNEYVAPKAEKILTQKEKDEKRIAELTEKNNKLGSDLAFEESKLPTNEDGVALKYTENQIRYKNSVLNMIDNNNIELERLNKRIGGTFRTPENVGTGKEKPQTVPTEPVAEKTENGGTIESRGKGSVTTSYPVVDTDEQFDALKSGDVFMGSDGVLRQKP